MSRKVSEADSSDRKGLLHFIGEHFSHEWTSALLVTSLVTIAVHQFHWLKALETYAYLAIGHTISLASFERKTQYGAVVVEIDQNAFERKYRERSPLDRCKLTTDLQTIYDASPDIVVIDLDLSPALSPWNQCEGDLENLIFERTRAKDACSPGSKLRSPNCAVRTVLLDPRLTDRESERYAVYRDWKKRLDSEHISFADGELPVNYGVLISPSENRDSIAATTSTLAGRNPANKIDSRQLLTGLAVLSIGSEHLPDLPAHKKWPTSLTFALDDWRENEPTRPKVVFFGGAYGSDDLFVTALGEIYGVEAHALAYVSDEIRKNEVVSFLADWTMAMFFSIAIAFFWGRYFDARMSDRATVRELARLWIILLAASVVIAVFVFSWLSYKLLARGFWLSPIPIAIGMLVDSFVSGSVDQAVRKFHALRRKLQADHGGGLHVTLNKQIVINAAAAQPASGLHWGVRYLPRALGGEICVLLLARKPFAVALLVLWMAIWMSALIVAIQIL